VVYLPTHLKNDGVKVSWDDEIPNIRKILKHVPKHQPDMITKVKSNKPFSAMSSGPVPDMSEEQALPWTKVVLSKDTF